MAKTVTVDVRIMDLPQVQRFNASVVALLETLGDCDSLPDPVTAAMERLWRDVEALSPDAGTPAAPSDEDRIRDAMAEARDHPGRIVITCSQHGVASCPCLTAPAGGSAQRPATPAAPSPGDHG